MAYEDRQQEFPLPGDEPPKRKSEALLPKFFRTSHNSKFLSSTIDQLLQPGVAEKLNGFYGRKQAKAFSPDDNYIGDVTPQRENYQFEAASVITDNLGNVEYYKDYPDFINQIKNFNGVNVNHSNANEQEFYSWNPHIDWDKFTNFREYYWLPTGPQTVVVPGETKEIVSTFTVSLQDNADNYSYLFTPDGLTTNPNLKLYRGVRYRFEINTPGLPLTFRTARTLDDDFLLTDEASAQVVEDGVIELFFNSESPNEIFYVADNDINIGGLIKIADVEEASVIDVDLEIVGKKHYTTRDGLELSNGMKLRFQGEVSPAKYQNSEWYVEGVGNKIQLISDVDVEVSFPVGIDLVVPFDSPEGFDRLPFGTATGYPRDKDFITINRASADGNFWSRYNRWFHKDVIEKSAKYNNQPSNVDQSQRATRPIIEFEAGLKLYNFGTKAKETVDLIDTYTTDAFSNIEGSLGYNIDGVDLTEGMRILFLNDTDPLVNSRIFEVTFVRFKGSGTDGQITLKETSDSIPFENDNTLVVQGEQYAGSIWYYDGTQWNRAQEKIGVNQPPLFDLFDSSGDSFADVNAYPATNFNGNKIFSYQVGSGTNDTVLGFPLSYRSIDNVGDIVFDFNYNSEFLEYQIDAVPQTLETAAGYLRKYDNLGEFTIVGPWIKANKQSEQAVLLQYVHDNSRIVFPINCFDNSQFLDDLKLIVFVNNKLVRQDVDYELVTTDDKFSALSFITPIELNSIIRIKAYSSASKNENGLYEIAPNLEKNPLNENVVGFTLGEVSDHVSSIVENLDNFVGEFPGDSNLRDIHDLSKFGRKFVKHSMPLNLPMYQLLDTDSNIVKSLRFARREYSKFKRLFLETANTLGYEGPVKEHVDKILLEINKDKINKMPFYFSDMAPYGAAIKTSVIVEDIDVEFFALSQTFTPTELSSRGLSVYLNNSQLLYGKDYIVNDENFLQILVSKQFNDVIDIYEYESTNGSYIPPTPTKLGLYPKFEPKIYIDTTYKTSTKVIEGHDGSIIPAFDDFRDNLILELEYRIFNNIKQSYDTSIFDINDYVSGSFRNTKFSRTDINQPMTADFVQWLTLIEKDYTTNEYFDRYDSFTFNYSKLFGPNNNTLPGWWRGVFKEIYDTDRPHTNPWEMLGYSIKPDWWEEQYGPAPYTSENLLLWEDLEKGIIRQPGIPFKINQKYVRPGLSNFKPVDADGNLLSPSTANIPINFNDVNIKDSFIFGDHAPVETAWRKSSEYPFAILTSWAINQTSKLLATGFDRSRQTRNNVGQIVYKSTGHHITLNDIVFPNTADDDIQVFTSGIINYISSYMASNVTSSFKNYNNRLKSIKNKLALKVGGFTDKDKFKLILDSRTPLNKGNVFVPPENYKIFLNTSSPLTTIHYSGVIVEKQPSGFILKGYNTEDPYFTYFEPLRKQSDPVINVGGISEVFSVWAPEQTLLEGKNVEYNNGYYRVLETHKTTSTFDPTKHAKLPRLPLSGGRDAIFSKSYDTSTELVIPYGTLLKTTQDVVDFLLGYGKWLESKGFRFEYYDGEEKILSNWETSSKEFMFWTTQEWDAGTLITLSPSADELRLDTDYTVVGDVFGSFYGYSILKADGKKLNEEDIKINRQDPNSFIIEPRRFEGIYSIQLPLVQKEHIVLIDNYTVFGDIIYEQTTGYRQDRLRVLGYRTTEWTGSLNIPGFVYDSAKIVEWESWTDYNIGAVVKYKEFYYSALSKITGTENFVDNEWTRLPEKPSAGLITNFEYKINQFADFYDLDSDNFDLEQQRLAQHLIGYQKRQYLENIINDDVSQYKFYQGMIADKGTENSLTKLFDVLGSLDKESLEFYEEWAIKEGQYGASDGFDEVEFNLDEKQFNLSPQPVELVTSTSGTETDLIYRIKPFEVYKKPTVYDHKPFPVAESTKFTKDAGYVNQEDVLYIVPSFTDVLTIPFADFDKEKYVWVGDYNNSWGVFKHTISENIITSMSGNADAVSVGSADKNQFSITLEREPKDIKAGDVIGIYDLISNIEHDIEDSSYPIDFQTTSDVQGFFKVLDVVLNTVIMGTSETIQDVPSCRGLITKFKEVRVKDYAAANDLTQEGVMQDDYVWIDNDDISNWKVLKNNQAYNLLQKITADESGLENEFGDALSVDTRNTVLVVGSPNAGDNGKVFIYTRGGNSQNFQFTQVIEPLDNLSDDGQEFGRAVAVSPDGKYIVVGSPAASNVKTRFRGEYETTADYQNGESILYNDQIWEVVVDINGAKEKLPFTSFGSQVELLMKYNITENQSTFKNLLLGKFPFTDTDTDHILVRAFADQYEATSIGDTVFLDWYARSTTQQYDLALTPRAPFEGEYPSVTEEFLEKGLVIQRKIDAVLFVPTFQDIPEIGDQIESTGVFGYVAFVYTDDGAATIYVENTSGVWDSAGSTYLETGEYIGEYQKSAPDENINTTNDLGGYWWFNLETTIPLISNNNFDEGKQLAVYNIVPEGEADPGAAGGNSYDQYNEYNIEFDSQNKIYSYIRTLTYEGFPGPQGVRGVQRSDLFVVRAQKTLTDILNVVEPGSDENDDVGLTVVNLPNLINDTYIDISPTGLQYAFTNKMHKLYDVWDGYIEFNLDEPDTNGFPFEPKVGQTITDSSAGGVATVAFIQRNGLKMTAFVKNVRGAWSKGSEAGDIGFLRMNRIANDPDNRYNVDNPVGEITGTSLGDEDLNIGGLVVIKLGDFIDEVPAQDSVIGAEYVLYKDQEILGRATTPNIPSQENPDWRAVYNIPVNIEGEPIPGNNIGMYSIYARENISTFTPIGSYIVPERTSGLRLGSSIQISKYNDFYRLFVGAAGNGTNDNLGKIYFVNNGTYADGQSFNWELSKHKNYRGEFGQDKQFYIDDIVFLDGNFYQAQTNIPPGNNFNNLDWERIAFDGLFYTGIDYLGVVPNYTDFVPDSDSSLKLDQENLISFGRTFDIDDTGEVLVTTAEYSVESKNRIVVYRSLNGNFVKSQDIIAPNTTMQFGEAISISSDGTLLAISAPSDSDEIQNQGLIYIYELQKVDDDFVFVLDTDNGIGQVLSSRNKRKGEQFGSNLQFDGKTLFVSAFNTNSDDITTFDVYSQTLRDYTLDKIDPYTGNNYIAKYVSDVNSTRNTERTYFDNGFTSFSNEINDNGVIYIYERVDNKLIYGQTIDSNDKNAMLFGRNIFAQQNHIYTTIPENLTEAGKKGAILDFRRPENKNIWEIHRSASNVVNLDKIKRVLVYDKEKNEIITNLDYIDPIQGKIAGPADQEISFKTIFDPAIYSDVTKNAPTRISVNKTESWGEEHVGRVWWDLTNAKFLNAYQSNIIYQTNNWNKLFEKSSIDIYEWVESTISPEQWDTLSDTEAGLSNSISGKTKYGNDVFVKKRKYDKLSETFTTYYYYWVQNKTTVPDVDFRSINTETIAQYITDPASLRYKFVTFFTENRFALWNCESIIKEKDIVLNIQYWTYSDKDSNIHNQYQILTEGLSSSKPGVDIERKWFDSLVGYDSKDRPVPNPNLSPNQRYGVLNVPRQGWFINRSEALKQFIERTNNILKDNLIVDTRNITKLFDNDAEPTLATRKFDSVVDTIIDLDFVGVARAVRCELSPVIENGKIIRVDIVNPGRAYLTTPTFEILGSGSGAEIELDIDQQGKVVSATVIDQGNNYKADTQIIVRRFTILVKNDDTIRGKWALYERIIETRSWNRKESQAFDTSLYWNYQDWYATGYNEFTEIDHVIERPYQLQSLDDNLGDIVKILTIGTGGWLLLQKVNTEYTTDYTVNYKTIGQQDGTIQFKEDLYNIDLSQVGFDSQSYDTKFFDSQPISEIRIILETIRDQILVDDLADEYNKLFFASLRYVFAEQGYVDWAFKTSFIKAQHNVGELQQKITFQNDNLESYQDYLEEVKPYKTKLREYVSNYDRLDSSSSSISDFDLPPTYNIDDNAIVPKPLRVIKGLLAGADESLEQYPNKHWLDNYTYQVIEIGISDPGEGYLTAPIITIDGSIGTGATAKASLGPNGKVSNVLVTNPGSGYATTPIVTLNGTLADGGRPAVLSAKIGNSLVRNLHTTMKFDRTTGAFLVTRLNQTEFYTGNNARTSFKLKYPMDMRTTTVEVIVDGDLALSSQYSYQNVTDTDQGYNRSYGQIDFTLPPEDNAVIEINYLKSVTLLSAADRISLFYNPTTGQIGNDIAQLMDGVDYGGTQVKSYEFGGPPGWDSDTWYDNAWDTYDEFFDDETISTDGSTTVFQLSKPLADGVTYNVYVNGVRVDDPGYDGTTSIDNLENKDAFMSPLVGDGVTDTFTIENLQAYQLLLERTTKEQPYTDPGYTETITIRRSTSDGSREQNLESFDTAISGGDIAYTTAKGLNADEITIDGDGFVTPTTSKGPEEHVPGQVLDTLDIQVYERPIGGSSLIYNRNYRGDGSTTRFDLGGAPYSIDSLIVKINNVPVVDRTDYRIDYQSKEIVFYTAPADRDSISLIGMGLAGDDIRDYDEFIADGETSEFLTNVKWTENISAYITVNGKILSFELFESDNSYDISGNVVIRFAQPPIVNARIQFALFESNAISYSQVTVEDINADGSSSAYEISQAPFNQEPVTYYTVVTVDGKILSTGYTEEFEISDSREYKLKLWQVPIGSVTGKEIEVFLNGRRLEYLQEWTYEGATAFNPAIPADGQIGSTVILNRGIGVPGDELKVYIVSGGEYRFGYFETADDSTGQFVSTTNTIHFDVIPEENSLIRIYQFSNHDSLDIDRIRYDAVERTQMTVGTEGYSEARRTRNGLIKLRSPAVSTAYVWVAINGEWLTPTSDYILLENKEYIKITLDVNEGDKLDLIHFSNPPLSTKYGWRQFKDMMNRNHYKRLGDDRTYKLSTDLNFYDRVIVLDDATDLPIPELGSRTPGIVFIGGERIEFFRRDGNELKQLRRGTLGTGIKAIHEVGTQVLNQSPDSTVPYKDETQVVNVKSGVYKDMSTVYENSLGLSFESIKYNFNNNTVFPLGTQVATVTGTGIRPTIKAFVQDIECETTYVSETEFTFITPALPVGAYDLVMYNDVETDPILIPATSYVESKVMKYVQILLPFAPLPNPKTETGWYKEQTEIPVSEIIPGRGYIISKLGDTNWNSIGATSSVGAEFTASSVGSGTGTVLDFSSIPYEYWEGMDIDVFISGRRLRKNPTTEWDHEVGQDSPDGDKTREAEFAVNKAVGAYVRLTDAPPPNVSITIEKRIGEIWNEIDERPTGAFKYNFDETKSYVATDVVFYNGDYYEALTDVSSSEFSLNNWKKVAERNPLGKSNTEVSNFLRGKTINLPR